MESTDFIVSNFQLPLCHVELVKLLLVHHYSTHIDIFSYSGPSGILGSDGKQNTP